MDNTAVLVELLRRDAECFSIQHNIKVELVFWAVDEYLALGPEIESTREDVVDFKAYMMAYPDDDGVYSIFFNKDWYSYYLDNGVPFDLLYKNVKASLMHEMGHVIDSMNQQKRWNLLVAQYGRDKALDIREKEDYELAEIEAPAHDKFCKLTDWKERAVIYYTCFRRERVANEYGGVKLEDILLEASYKGSGGELVKWLDKKYGPCTVPYRTRKMDMF